MPYMFSIHDMTFVNLESTTGPGGPPPLAIPQTQIVQRPGVDGTGVIDLGQKGQPFQMRSLRDLDSVNDAADALNAYYTLIAIDPVILVWKWINFKAAYNHVYAVLDVQPVRICRLSAAAGGLSTSQGAALEALWTLLPIYLGE